MISPLYVRPKELVLFVVAQTRADTLGLEV